MSLMLHAAASGGPRDEYLTLSVRASEGAPGSDASPRRHGGPAASRSPAREEVPGASGPSTATRRSWRLPSSGTLRRRAAGRAVGPDPGPVFALPTAPWLHGRWRTPVTCGSGPLPAPRMPLGLCPTRSGPSSRRSGAPTPCGALAAAGRAARHPAAGRRAGDDTRAGPTASRRARRAGGDLSLVLPRRYSRVGDRPRQRRSSPPALARSEAWVAASRTRTAPPRLGVTPAVVGSVHPHAHCATGSRCGSRSPTACRSRSMETDRTLALTLYGAVGDVNWIRYGATDSLVRRVTWAQNLATGGDADVRPGAPVWGYRARWDRGDLVLDIRRPPPLDAGRPAARATDRDGLRDTRPPGATGPTGLREAEANLGVGARAARLLEAAGRPGPHDPDRRHPARSSGRACDSRRRGGASCWSRFTTTPSRTGSTPSPTTGPAYYYNQPRSVPLARAIQRELVRRLGLPRSGNRPGRPGPGPRTTWMPSVLTEGLFMIVPEQEAALRSRRGPTALRRGDAGGDPRVPPGARAG